MPHENIETIESVVSEVMEQLAFLFVDRVEADELPDTIQEAMHVSLGFSGALATGRLELITSNAIACELAANITGDDDVSAEAAQQTLMEVANILCGRLLTEIAGTTPVFDLQSPVVEPWKDEQWPDVCVDANAAAFMSDDQPLLVRFEMISTVPLTS